MSPNFRAGGPNLSSGVVTAPKQLYQDLQAIRHSGQGRFADVRGYSWKIEFCEHTLRRCDRDMNIEIDRIAPPGFMAEAKLQKLKSVIASRVRASMKIKVRVISIEDSEINVANP